MLFTNGFERNVVSATRYVKNRGPQNKQKIDPCIVTLRIQKLICSTHFNFLYAIFLYKIRTKVIIYLILFSS